MLPSIATFLDPTFNEGNTQFQPTNSSTTKTGTTTGSGTSGSGTSGTGSSTQVTATPVYACPGDDAYYLQQLGVSYEYWNSQLANKTRQQVMKNKSSSTVTLMYDCDYFHGSGGRLYSPSGSNPGVSNQDRGSGVSDPSGLNYLYADGHVDNS